MQIFKNSPGVMLSNQVRYTNPSTSSSSSSRNPPESPIQFQFNHYSTSPVMVPGNVCNRTNDPQRTGSPACGSWQVISSSGSLRGFVSSTDSLHSAGSIIMNLLLKLHAINGYIYLILCRCQEATEIPETNRFQKLDSVRRIFNNAYTNKIVTKPELAALAEMSATNNNFMQDNFEEICFIQNTENAIYMSYP
ncbi:hypothetical protein KUTeg_020828 [Tegillarca granosa]|uniref:Uncharacterized protein n=1 Tax=Tegillarca granosa TaxID=220873 RepID=A0ABQ9EDD2_TEGGR|nr:hypothetical protein KUTeg_020828 [Tegillarca granosa]